MKIASLEIALAYEVDSLLIFKFNLNKFSDFGVDIWKFWDMVQYSLKFAWEVLTGFVSCSGDMAFKFDCVLSKSKNFKKPVRDSPVDAWQMLQINVNNALQSKMNGVSQLTIARALV